MKPIFTFFAGILVAVATAWGHPVDLGSARAVGARFLNSSDLQFVKSYNLADGTAAFYVFNAENGFVIVSAENSTTPILAYSKAGRFEERCIPSQMQGYLNAFVEQIQYAVDNHIVADEQMQQRWERAMNREFADRRKDAEGVGPLITSQWNQNYPYNMMCPEEDGGPGGHDLAGCTATAMAQVMRYWGCPQTGQGSYGGIDFGNTTYQWDAMLDMIDRWSDIEEITPIATLLWHCGVTLDMEYGIYVSNAAINQVPEALTTYFKYSPDMTFEYRDIWGDPIYSDEEWFAKVKASLDLGRPLVYGSFVDGTTDMGHIFVCDGYDADSLLHMNWGWGGSGDAFFALGALNGGGYGFNTCNCAVFNIHPEEPVDPEPPVGIKDVVEESEVVSREVYDILGHRADELYKTRRPGVYIIRSMMRSGKVVTNKSVIAR